MQGRLSDLRSFGSNLTGRDEKLISDAQSIKRCRVIPCVLILKRLRSVGRSINSPCQLDIIARQAKPHSADSVCLIMGGGFSIDQFCFYHHIFPLRDQIGSVSHSHKYLVSRLTSPSSSIPGRSVSFFP